MCKPQVQVWRIVPEGVGIPRDHKEAESNRSEEGCNLLKVSFLDEAPPGLTSSDVSLEHGVSQFCCFLEGFTHSFEDVAKLMRLPLSREANSKEIIFNRDNKSKLKYQLLCHGWLPILLSFSVCAAKWHIGWPRSILVPARHSNCQGCSSCWIYCTSTSYIIWRVCWKCFEGCGKVWKW